jgi:hypothetical protein
MGKEKRMAKHIAKELILQGYTSCDVNQVLDNFKVRLQRAATEEEKEEIIQEYKQMYNVETTSL